MYFVLFFIFEALGESCSKYYGDYYKVVAQLNEKFVIDSKEIFDSQQDYSNYKLIDQDNKLQIQQPIQQLGGNIIDDDEEQIVIRISSLFNQFNGWQNYFALFRISKSNYEILDVSDANLKFQNRLPKFDQTIILDSTENVKCHDFVVYQKNQFIVDCFELKVENPKNFFYYIIRNPDTQEIVKTKIENNYQFSKDYSRYLQLSSTSEQYYLYRITQNLNTDNQIEVFKLNLKDNQILLITSINKQFFIDQQFTKEYPEYQTFYLQNVKSDYFSSKIAFTDLKGYLIILTYYKDRWLLKVDYHEQGIGIKNFDYIFETEEFAIQSKNYLIVGKEQKNYKIEFSSDISTYKPQFTKSFIVLKDSTNLLLISNQLILNEHKGQFSVDLFDYLQDDFLVVEKNSIKRYYAENNLKIVFNPSDQADLNNHQAIIQYKECKVQLEYQAIQSTYTQLIQVRKGNTIFADEGFISLPTTSWTTFNDYVIGPLKSKTFLNKNQTINEELQFQSDIEVDLSTISDAKDVMFLRVIYQQSQDLEKSYIILTHNQTNVLTIRKCIFFPQKQECNKQIQFNLEQGVILTDQNSAFEYDGSNVIIYICDNLIYKTTINIESGKTYTKNRKILNANLNPPSIGLMKQSVIIWSQDSNIITIFNKETLKSKYQFILQSNHDRIFCDYNTDTMYTYNQDQKSIYQIILKTSTVFTSLRLQLQNEVVDVNMFFSEKLFSLIQKFQDGKVNVQAWNKESQINSFFIKQLPLYDYEIADINDVSYSQTNSILYVKSKQNLLVFYIDQPNHNSLQNVMQIDEKLTYFQGIYGLLFGIVDKQLKLYSFNYLNQAQYQFVLEKQDFVDKRDYLVSYANKENKINLEQNFKILNYHIKISLKPENLKIITNLTKSNQDYYIQGMGTNWYEGLVTKVKSVGNSGVSILQQVNQVQEKFAANINDAEDFNDEALLTIFYSNYALISKRDGSLIKQFKFGAFLMCNKIMYVKYNQSALLDCRINERFILVSIVCKGSECQSSDGLQLQKIVNKVFIFGNQMFLVHPFSIEAYTINDDLLKINQAKSQGELLISENSCSEMNKVRENHYHRYYFDQLGNLLIDEIKIEDDKVQIFNTITVNIFEIVNVDYFIKFKDNMRKIIILSSISENTDLVVDLLFLQYAGSHYGFRFTFQCQAETCVLSQQRINLILQGHPQYNLLLDDQLQIQAKNNHLLIPYQAEESQDNFIGVYKIPPFRQQNYPIMFNGCEKFVGSAFYLIMKLAVYDEQDYLFLNNISSNILAKYLLSNSPKIVFDGKFNKTNNVTIYALNDFDQQSLDLSIIVTEEDVKDEGSLVWLWITLGIVGGVVIIGAGFYFYCKKKNQVEDQLIS